MSQAPRSAVKGAHGLPLSSEAELVPPRSRAGGMRSRGLKDRYEGTGLANPSLAKNTGRLGHRKANKTIRDLLAWGTRRNTTSLLPSPPGLWYSGPLYPRVQPCRQGGPARDPGDRGETWRRPGAGPGPRPPGATSAHSRGSLGTFPVGSLSSMCRVIHSPGPSRQKVNAKLWERGPRAASLTLSSPCAGTQGNQKPEVPEEPPP